MAKTKPAPATVSAGETVWVAVVHHKHGESFYVAITKEGLFEQLFEFVDQWWQKEMDGREMPEDHGEAIDQYFAYMNERGQEFYEWSETNLGS